jgi:hypothetical protein
MRLENAYQKMFHPTKDVEESQKKKHIGKAVGLWIGTLGLYPLVAGISHLIKKFRAKHKTPQELTPTDNRTTSATSSTLSISRSPSLSGTPTSSPSGSHSPSPSISSRSSSYGPQDELKTPLAAPPSVTKSEASGTQEEMVTTDPAKLAKEWEARVEMVRKRADAGSANDKFQLLVWQEEGRNIGHGSIGYMKTVEAAIQAKNPEAMALGIKILYEKIDDTGRTKEIDKEIDELRADLEQLTTPEAQVAKVKVLVLEGKWDKVRLAADKGNLEAKYQLGIKNRRTYGDDLMEAARNGHPEAQYQLAEWIDQKVLTGSPEEYHEWLAKAANQGHVKAFGDLLDEKRQAKATHPSEFDAWLEAGRMMFTDKRMLQG